MSPLLDDIKRYGNSQRLTLDIAQCPEFLKIFEFSGRQSLSTAYEFNARFACDIPDLDLNSLIQQAAIITLQYKNETRYYHGIVSHAAMTGENGQSWLYKVQIVPRLWFLNYRSNCRIFQHKTVQDIISQLLDEASFRSDAYEFRLKNQYSKREYTVQYNETDFSFLSRLLEVEGIHYHFVHRSNGHRMVFADCNELLPLLEQPELELRPRNGLEADYTSFANFSRGQRLGFEQASHTGFDLTRPAQPLNCKQQSHQKEDGQSDELEHYSFHDEQSFDTVLVGQHTIEQSLQAFESQKHYASGESDISMLEPGYRFTLDKHPRSDFNDTYLVHDVSFKVRQYAILEQYAQSDAGFSYTNQARFIPADIAFKPPHNTPRPQLDFQDGVFVTGPEGEEIYTDKYGRIKVQFPWDREGQNNEHSSCWLPVSQSWAGNQWGKIHIPRIGHEVLVSFINGDPDQPVVVGSLYNGKNRPPYELPKHKTRSTTKTNSSLDGQGFNEIRMEDKKGQEQLAIFAEKDLDNRVKHDRREHIEHDRHLVVQEERFEHIKNNRHIHTEHNRMTEIGQDCHLHIGQSHHTQIGKDLYIHAGNEIHIKAGNKLVFDAGDSLSMSAGGSVMQTGTGGIGFNGATIRINAGGSPGNGTGASPIAPHMPREADRDYPGYKDRERQVLNTYKQSKLTSEEFAEIPAPPIQPVPIVREQQWLAIQVVDSESNVMRNLSYKIIKDNTVVRQGKLDNHGYAQYPGIEADDYQVVFERGKTTQSGDKIPNDFAPSKPKTDFTPYAMGEKSTLALKTINRFQLHPDIFIHLEIDINAPESRNDRFTLMTDDGQWQQSLYLHDLPPTKTNWVELQFSGVPQKGLFHLIEDPMEEDMEPFCVFTYYEYDDLKKINNE